MDNKALIKALTLCAVSLLTVLLLLQVDTLVVSAQPQSRQLQRQAEPVNTWPAKAKRWALVIGVDKYRDPQIGSLKGSENDARTISDALVRYAGFPSDQVILLATDQPDERQPTRVNILRRLSNLTSVVPKDGLLLISFAGHGMERNGNAYLLPTDAQISEDISFLEDTALSVSRIKERIRATGVTQVVILLDACRNDPGGRADAPNLMSSAYVRSFNFDVKNREVQAFATIYATAVGQRAYEYSERRQGYFTWAVVEGLKGAAANSNGEITLASLVDYVQKTVPKRIGIELGGNKQQRPFAVIEGYKADQLVIAVGGVSAEVAAKPASSADTSAAEMTFWETIKGSKDPGDFQAYLDRFPDGMFAALARRRLTPNNGPETSEAKAPSTTAAPIGNVDDVLAQATRDLQDKSYSKALSLAEGVLAGHPENPRANAVAGLAYLQLKRYVNSKNFLSKAITLGEVVDIPIQHQHSVLLSGDALCSGYIRLNKGLLEFHSYTAQKDDFAVPAAKVYEMVTDGGGGGRIRMKVGVDKDGKEEKRNLAFHPGEAYVGKKTGSAINMIYCENCFSDVEALSQLLQELIKATVEKQASPIGANSTSDNSGSANGPAASTESNAPNALLNELLEIEKRAFDLGQRGDRAALAPMMGDEFTQTTDKKTYNKSQLLNMVKPRTSTMSYNYEAVEVSQQGDVVTLEGTIILRSQSGGAMATVKQKFKDTFVRHNGGWLIVKSEIITLK